MMQLRFIRNIRRVNAHLAGLLTLCSIVKAKLYRTLRLVWLFVVTKCVWCGCCKDHFS